MAVYHSEYTTDLAAPLALRLIPNQFAMGDNDAYIFTALVCDSADPQAGLMDGMVAGTLLRPDGATVAIEGEKGSDVVPVHVGDAILNATPCSVTLPQACFAFPGRVLLTIKLTHGTTVTSVLTVSGTVTRTETDSAVDPGEIIPDLASLQAAAADALAAADEARDAAEDAEDAAATIAGDIEGLESAIARRADCLDEEDGAADLDITDSYGNVLARFEDGKFRTKDFRGFAYITYASPSGTYTGAALTLTCAHAFNAGDRVILHCERGAKPWDSGAEVTYYEGETEIKSAWRGDCAYLEHTVTTDGATFTAAYAASATGMQTGAVQLQVSLLGDAPIRPTVITVKPDGSGDYTTLRGALDAIGTTANEALNPYRIELYPGTYEVMDDYTDEEIAAAVYTDTGFVGPKLLDGMHLVGMGLPHETVIYGVLDTTTWSSTIRNAISPLNMQGCCSVENLTIISENLRYCIHDDYGYPYGMTRHAVLKNLVMRFIGAFTTERLTTYGAGTTFGGMRLYAENCDFGASFGIHNQRAEVGESMLFFRNCKATQADFSDIVNQDIPASRQNVIIFDSCDFCQVTSGTWNMPVYTTPHVTFRGTLTGSPMYSMHPGALYDTSDVAHTPATGLDVGIAVESYLPQNGPGVLAWKKATSAAAVGGVIVHNDTLTTYVQTRGYVATDRLGLTSVAVGDLVGINSDGEAVIVQSDADAWGVVAYVNSSGVGFVRMKGDGANA